jgi:hypothetical protein
MPVKPVMKSMMKPVEATTVERSAVEAASVEAASVEATTVEATASAPVTAMSRRNRRPT